MYRIMIARNGYYYGQKKNRFGYWSRCTPFRLYRGTVRTDINVLRNPPYCNPRVVEYL